ncbi:MAG: anhydro-N-acetylmuramic acid kinase [Nitrospira sp.]|jgi:anhydro-N-acetylmuramic acid kinase|nr:anhydro-N-acetylmuramic acid kinase [Nitrospira sp. BO4]
MNVVGLMSGTSADGVDAALVSIDRRKAAIHVEMVAFHSLPYPRSLQQRILSASVSGTVTDICHLNALLGEWFADAALGVIRAAHLTEGDVDLIGSHGQTVHHLPNGIKDTGVGSIRSTLQIAEPAVIAERTGITTVANFRPRDIAAGGQGAPLTPGVHALLFQHPRRARLIVNLGGISNVTYLPRRSGTVGLAAFDTGPANMVLDGIMVRATNGRSSMDREGRLAARGQVDSRLLAKLLAHPYLSQAPPKSTGREAFGAKMLDDLLTWQQTRKLPVEDLLATCSRWTAEAVGTARRWVKGGIDEVIVGGGGVKNRAIMGHLTEVFAPVPVTTFESHGWDSKALESVAFAVLAYQTVMEQCGNVPSVTGAAFPRLLGCIVPSGPRWFERLHPRKGRK